MKVQFEETDGARGPMFDVLPANYSTRQAKQLSQPAIAVVSRIFWNECRSFTIIIELSSECLIIE